MLRAFIDGDDERYTQSVWRQILRFFDSDHDGTIDAEEMAPALRSLGIDVTESTLKETVSKMDADSSGTIDYGEFRAYYHSLFAAKMKEGVNTKWLREQFEKYDVDSSGFLDVAEFCFVESAWTLFLCSFDDDAK